MSTRTRVLDALVFGVDVQSGDVRGNRPSYALVRLDGRAETVGDREGEVAVERDVVTHRKLCRLLERDEPALVATDNMYELAADKDDLVHFLGALPDATTLVQVTGDERPEPLSRVAKRHGVPYGKQAMEEAEAAARLAARNVGYAVSAFGETTEVRVTRGRSTGKGGWSADRYTRRIHGSVKRRAREVADDLRDAGLDFEREVTEKYGGFSRAVFTVEARPDDIPVSQGRSGDVRVELERERRDGIEFRPLAKRRDHVLVGVDPGTTTAVAVVGLDGDLLDVWSTRTADVAEVIEWIVERGRPVVVAADVTPMPETVEKIRRSFDAAAWTPGRDLPIDEKQHRTREVGYDDDHQRDAAAAALLAHDDHDDQIRRVTRTVPPTVDRGEVCARVLAGEESVEAVLRDLADDGSAGSGDGGGDGSGDEQAETEPSEEQRRLRRQAERIERLEAHVDELEDDLAARDERIEELEGELAAERSRERQAVRETREVTRLEREVERLEGELADAEARSEELADKLERLKELWRLDHSDLSAIGGEERGLVPVKPVAKFTNDAIAAADEEYGLVAGDVVWLRDASGAGRSTARALADVEPRLVLRSGGLSEVADEVLFERDVPVAPAGMVEVEEVDELAVAREDEVEAAVADWEERAAEREKERTEEMVDQIVSEHRAGET
ncbi:MAG: DUF460 domain-containing protein [Halobacteriaceae archaeon]